MRPSVRPSYRGATAVPHGRKKEREDAERLARIDRARLRAVGRHVLGRPPTAKADRSCLIDCNDGR